MAECSPDCSLVTILALLIADSICNSTITYSQNDKLAGSPLLLAASTGLDDQSSRHPEPSSRSSPWKRNHGPGLRESSSSQAAKVHSPELEWVVEFVDVVDAAKLGSISIVDEDGECGTCIWHLSGMSRNKKRPTTMKSLKTRLARIM